MIFVYGASGGRIAEQPRDGDLGAALWIDLYSPQPEQVAAVRALGVDVPTLAEMEEIEISNRIYREGDTEYLTVVLPGQTPDRKQIAGPVTFILSPRRLVTVRHHAPRPFETFPARSDKSGTGCASPARLFLGLVEEIIGRLADHLEGAGKQLDRVTRDVFVEKTDPAALHLALVEIGRETEVIGRVRLGLLTLERALTYIGQSDTIAAEESALRPHLKARLRDIQSLEVHADFLSARTSNTTDATLGMVNLAQNATVRVLSGVAALFLPPTLIASIYGMNFEVMPELKWAAGYPFSLGLMLASMLVTYAFLKWMKWL
ncbi:MAG: magnesium transporter CorA family protein [Rhodobacteraceae bacterium]|nr:magnesium transporter CorA family protein [Paracoccaceae bacterium]